MICSADGRLRLYHEGELTETVAFGMEFAIRAVEAKSPIHALVMLSRAGLIEVDERGHVVFTDEGYARFAPCVADPDWLNYLDRLSSPFRIPMDEGVHLPAKPFMRWRGLKVDVFD